MILNISLDLFALGVVVASNLVLGFAAFYEKPKSVTSRLFLFLTAAISVYNIASFFTHHVTALEPFLWVLRFTMFSAVLFACGVFFLATNFPSDTWLISRRARWSAVTLSALTLIATISPYVFTHASINGESTLPIPHAGIGMILFGFTVLILDVWGLVVMIKKSFHATGEDRARHRYLLFGFLTTLTLIVVCNFIFPVILNSTIFVPYSVLFTLPFVGFTAYAIFKHHLLGVKVLSTEILIFVLAVVILFEVFISNTPLALALRAGEFVLVLIFGVLLIQSVLKEVRQRQQLQILTHKLEDANVQLKQLDQARADFITLTSHQLRTPPATIKWYLAAIRSGDFGALSHDLNEAITKTEVTNNALISLIDDLLNASRIERGKLEFLFDPVKIDEIARFTVEQLQPQAHLKNLALSYEPPTKPVPEVMADKEKIRQVINNFIDNAIKYTQQGHIVTRVRADDEFVYVEVEDTGKGMDPEVIPSLFKKYSRGKDSITHATGIGIGLYVAKIVIENHNGDIGAKSPGIGKGSTFFFRLPVKNSLPHTKIMDLVKAQNTVDTV